MPAFAASAVDTPAVKSVVRVDARTGKLTRIVTAPPSAPIPRETLDPIIDRIAEEQGVEAPLVHSVIQAESNYSAAAVSPKGAQGIMQLIPETAKRFGVANSFDPAENIEGGVKYLRFLLDYFHGDYARAIAAYNAGEKAVDRYKGVPPYAETQNYVNHVAKSLRNEREKQTVRPAANIKISEHPTSVETNPSITASVGSDGRVYYRTP